MDFCNSANRFVPESKSRRIKTLHLSLIIVNVVSTGQFGNVSVLILVGIFVSQKH